MGQRSLQGPNAVSIMESLLAMLARVLSPIMGNHGGGVIPHTGQVDLSLIGWILLFLCRNLDNTLTANGSAEEEGASKKEKDQGENCVFKSVDLNFHPFLKRVYLDSTGQ